MLQYFAEVASLKTSVIKDDMLSAHFPVHTVVGSQNEPSYLTSLLSVKNDT